MLVFITGKKSYDSIIYADMTLSTTQPTSGRAVTAVTNCCANCAKPSRPKQWGSNLPFLGASRPREPDGWLALLLTKVGDVETNPGPTILNKRVWICDICYKQIHVRKQISIRCNRNEHWVHLRCAGVRQAQYQGVHLSFKANNQVGYWDYQIQSPTKISTSPLNCPIFAFIITYIIMYHAI